MIPVRLPRYGGECEYNDMTSWVDLVARDQFML